MIRDEQSLTNIVAAIWVLIGTAVIVAFGFQTYRSRDQPPVAARSLVPQQSRLTPNRARTAVDETAPLARKPAAPQPPQATQPQQEPAPVTTQGAEPESSVPPELDMSHEQDSTTTAPVIAATATSASEPTPEPGLLSREVTHTAIELAPPAIPLATPPISAPRNADRNPGASERVLAEDETASAPGQVPPAEKATEAANLKPFFGVGMRDTAVPRVTTLYANSTAVRLDVRLGDHIVAFNGQTISNLDDLRRVLAPLQVGEEVRVTVQRGGQHRKLGPVPLQGQR